MASYLSLVSRISLIKKDLIVEQEAKQTVSLFFGGNCLKKQVLSTLQTH